MAYRTAFNSVADPPGLVKTELYLQRAARGLTQLELAYKAGFSQSVVSSAERGMGVPITILEKLAAALGFKGDPKALQARVALTRIVPPPTE